MPKRNKFEGIMNQMLLQVFDPPIGYVFFVYFELHPDLANTHKAAKSG